MAGIKLTTEKFILNAVNRHGEIYDYSNVNYVDSETKIEIICKKHGSFFQTPHSHMRGYGCRKCALEYVQERNKKGIEYFLNKALEIHDNKYDYSSTKFDIVSEKVTIICPKHGEFTQDFSNHLIGQGCPLCGRERDTSLWSYGEWKEIGEKSKHFDSFKVYVIYAWNEEESFVKIGKTFSSIGRRFRGGNNTFLPYNYKVLNIIEGSSLYISKLENEFHKKCKEYKYVPQIQFSGMKECYTEEALNKIIDYD